MGEPVLRCLDCYSKFGPIVADLRCGLCGTLFRLREYLYSDTFPEEGRLIAEVEVRNLYLRLQETGTRIAQNPLGPGTLRWPEGVPEARLQTTPKAKPAEPPKKGDTSEEPGEASGSKPAPIRSPEEIEKEVALEKEKKEKKSRKKSREEKGDGRKSPQKKKDKKKSRSPGRSRSRQRKVKEEVPGEIEEDIRQREEVEARRKERDRSRVDCLAHEYL